MDSTDIFQKVVITSLRCGGLETASIAHLFLRPNVLKQIKQRFKLKKENGGETIRMKYFRWR